MIKSCQGVSVEETAANRKNGKKWGKETHVCFKC